MIQLFLKKLQSDYPGNEAEYLSFFAFNPEKYHCEVLDPLDFENRPLYSLTIDYPEDLELARNIYSKYPQDYIPSIKEVIRELDSSQDYIGVDQDSLIKLPDSKTMTYKGLIDYLNDLGKKAKEINKIKGINND